MKKDHIFCASISERFVAITKKSLTTTFCLLFLGSSMVLGGTEAEDAAVIKGCDDPVLVGIIQHGRNKDELKFVVNDSWRGDIKEGTALYIKSETADGETDEDTGFEPGSQWIVMGTLKDGFFVCENDINYKYTHEKGHWMQVVLGILPE